MSSRAEEKAARREERESRERAEAQSAARRKRLTQLGSVAILAVVVVVAAIVLANRGGSDKGKTDASGVTGSAEAAALMKGIPQNGLVLGDPKAPVTLVEFADLQCPFCAQFTLNTLPTVIDKFVRTGRIKIQLSLMRFIDDDSDRVGKAAIEAADQGNAWTFVDLWYRNQPKEGSGGGTDALIKKIANASGGLDADKMIKAISSTQTEQAMSEMLTRADRHKVTSTPTFFTTSGDVDGDDLKPVEFSSTDPDQVVSALDAHLKTAHP